MILYWFEKEHRFREKVLIACQRARCQGLEIGTQLF
jgi:hypothetical protein